jgi:prepilin-type N-terminal cleavage/methylation domain-containing protein
MDKKAFTLAEVLITLGIIGVVAALTMPSLIINYKKRTTVTQIKKFYTNINQVLKLSEIDNGSADTWDISSGREGYNTVLAFYNKYFSKYMTKTKEVKPCPWEPAYNLCVYQPDGTVVDFHIWGGLDIAFISDIKCRERFNKPNGRCSFSFQFGKPGSNSESGKRYIIEPYSNGWNGTREGLKTHSNYGCRKEDGQYINVFCTKLIQYDGWEIRDDYPW